MSNNLDKGKENALKPKNIISKNDNKINDSSYNETLSNKLFLPEENIDKKDNEESSFSSVIKKKNLLFEEQDVSFIKLYLHLSNRTEIILMILGVIAAFGSGVAAPLMCYLFGDMANNFSSVNADDSVMELMKKLLNCKNEEEVIKLCEGDKEKEFTYLIFYHNSKELFTDFEDEVDTMV